MIDHTLLKPDASRKDVETLCREAAEHAFATVCVNPTWVALCRSLLQRTSVGVCTVVGFPLGATTADTKQYETRRVIFDGASEVDMVINVGALKSGDLRTVERDIEAVVAPCRDAGVTSKVIIEAALLTDEEKAQGFALFCQAKPLSDIVIEVREVRRAGDIHDIADAIASVVSDDMRYVTAHTIHLTGGYYVG